MKTAISFYSDNTHLESGYNQTSSRNYYQQSTIALGAGSRESGIGSRESGTGTHP
ncbi:MAG: AraC family transcriptional regulator [Moorea sp. SIO4A3]|nr:AraC family transcriptional regulator [Moorena sp. SIO4A3]